MNNSFIPLEWKAFHQPQWGLTQTLRAWCIYSFLHWVVLHFGCSPTVLSGNLCHLFHSSVTSLFLFQPHGREAHPASEQSGEGGASLLVFSMSPFGLNFTSRGRMLPLSPYPWPCFMSYLARQAIKCFSTQSSRMSRAYGLPVALTC